LPKPPFNNGPKHGYATVRKLSKTDKKKPPLIRKVWVICDKAGKPRTIKSLEIDEEPSNEPACEEQDQKKPKKGLKLALAKPTAFSS